MKTIKKNGPNLKDLYERISQIGVLLAVLAGTRKIKTKDAEKICKKLDLIYKAYKENDAMRKLTKRK